MQPAPVPDDPAASRSRRETPLLRWVWRAFSRNALIPLLLVELVLIAVYLTSHSWSRHRNVTALREMARDEVVRIAADESAIIEQQLGQVAALTDVLRRQAALALAKPAPRQEDRSRLRLQPSGLLTTVRPDGGAAVFYSALTPKGPEQFEKLSRLAVLDPLLRDITESNPLVVQAYVNTHDSLNRIWPWIDAAAQFDPYLNIPAFNFYYEADAARNPSRSVVWTDAYVDPAGKGWMVSAIAPVYRGDFLEGVVGADVTLDRMIAGVLSTPIPWQGFLLLVGKDGTLLALPPRAEELFSLRELFEHHYDEAILADTFKPEEFNVFRRADLAAIGELLAAQPGGNGRLDEPAPHLVAWRTIPSAGWKLLVLVPEQQVFGPAQSLARDLTVIGWIMLAGLAGFYVIFFTILYRRAGHVSRTIAQPLQQIERMARRIAVGDYEQRLPEFDVREFRHTVGELQRMGRLLGDSDRARQAAEERLTERNEELSTILSLTPDGLVYFDAGGTVTETNPAFLALTGWSRDEVIGTGRAAFWSRLATLGSVTEPAPGVASTLRLARPHQAVLECRVVAAAGGAQVAYFRDVTRADELDRMKSEFLATAAHELRTPIAVIAGYTEFLQARDPAPEARQEMLATMRRHGDHITGIVTELLDLSRIEARAGRDFTMRRQALEPVVRDFVGTFRLAEDPRLPALAGELGGAEAVVDADKFCQALGNVLSNAYKYSEPGTPIDVRLVRAGDEAGVEVRDRGSGMDEDERRRVFERFYRAEAAAGVPGTGLGMSIVKEIMDIHGGRVTIDSERGRGTTVTLWLPLAASLG